MSIPNEMPQRSGNVRFYRLLERLANLHEKKSQDYASSDNPVGNYHFAGMVCALFSHSTQDAGFAGRLAEKIYRLANLEKDSKKPNFESIEDSELDICVLTLLWMSDRQDRRTRESFGQGTQIDDRTTFYDNVHKTEIAPPERTPNRKPFQEELFDLIRLMPDYQTDEIIEFIASMRRTRYQAKSMGQQS